MKLKIAAQGRVESVSSHTRPKRTCALSRGLCMFPARRGRTAASTPAGIEVAQSPKSTARNKARLKAAACPWGCKVTPRTPETRSQEHPFLPSQPTHPLGQARASYTWRSSKHDLRYRAPDVMRHHPGAGPSPRGRTAASTPTGIEDAPSPNSTARIKARLKAAACPWGCKVTTRTPDTRPQKCPLHPNRPTHPLGQAHASYTWRSPKRALRNRVFRVNRLHPGAGPSPRGRTAASTPTGIEDAPSQESTARNKARLKAAACPWGCKVVTRTPETRSREYPFLPSHPTHPPGQAHASYTCRSSKHVLRYRAPDVMREHPGAGPSPRGRTAASTPTGIEDAPSPNSTARIKARLKAAACPWGCKAVARTPKTRSQECPWHPNHPTHPWDVRSRPERQRHVPKSVLGIPIVPPIHWDRPAHRAHGARRSMFCGIESFVLTDITWARVRPRRDVPPQVHRPESRMLNPQSPPRGTKPASKRRHVPGDVKSRPERQRHDPKSTPFFRVSPPIHWDRPAHRTHGAHRSMICGIGHLMLCDITRARVRPRGDVPPQVHLPESRMLNPQSPPRGTKPASKRRHVPGDVRS